MPVTDGPEGGAADGPGRPGRGHGAQRAARRRAVDVLYQSDITGRPPTEVIEAWRQAGKPVTERAADLAQGVEADLSRIDRLLGEHAEGWTVARMATVDRSILRVATFELLAGVPPAVAINEAVDMAAELSTEASGRFINGVLGKVARVLGA